MKRYAISIVVMLTIACLASQVTAVVPHRITYQGRLTEAGGMPIDTIVDMTFRIYETDVSTTLLWSQTHGSVLVQDGLFSAILSSFGDMAGTFDGSERWLSVQVGDGAESHPRVRIESSAYAYRAEVADTAAFALAVAGGGASHWTLTDGVLYSEAGAGVARGEVGNDLRGDSAMTHVNLGTASITGSFGQAYPHITLSGGRANLASESFAVVAGGRNNNATDYAAVVGGGATNAANGSYSVVSGGTLNTAGSTRDAIGGGEGNSTNGWYATIAGGRSNSVNGGSGFVGGGENNTAGFGHATVGAGYGNSAGGQYSAILGGYSNTIESAGKYSYLFGIQSMLTEDSTFMVDLPHIRFGDEVDGYEFPEADGDAGQVLTTDGSGQVSWATPSTSTAGIDELIKENQELKSLLDQLEKRIAQLETKQ